MTWTIPRTWTNGEFVTETILNGHVRDNLSFLYNRATVSADRNASTTLSNDTWTTITFGNEDWDTNGLHSTVTNTGRLTIPSGFDGIWLFTMMLDFDTNTSGSRGVRLVTNGSTLNYGPMVPAATTTLRTRVSHTLMLDASAGDYFTVEGYQNRGGTLDVVAGKFQAVWIAP